MKRILGCLLAFWATADVALAQGTITFANSATTLVKFSTGDGVPTALRGTAIPTGTAAVPSDFRAGLYWGVTGSTEAGLVSAGAPALIAPVAGRFAGGTRTTGAGTPPGGQAVFQVRVWSHGARYATYEAASTSADPAVYIGSSTVFANGTGGAGSPPGPAVALSGFMGITNVRPLIEPGPATNKPPVLVVIPDRTFPELTSLVLTNAATDTDDPPQVLTHALVSGPAGLTINTSTGVMTWTPSEAQGPGAYDVEVTVTDDGTPLKAATNRFRLTVNEVNDPPVIAAIPDQAVPDGQFLELVVPASDRDLPPNVLVFGLEPGAPSGMTIDGAGVLRWTPAEWQRPGTFPVTVRVTDSGTPALVATRTFVVVAAGAATGGSVTFANSAGTLVRYGGSPEIPEALRGTAVPVGTTAALGPADYRSALYWGPTGTPESAMRQIGLPAAISPVAGRFSGGTRLTGAETAPGTAGLFQVRIWSHGSSYPTYEEALSSGNSQVYVGNSTVFTNATGGAGSPPGPAMALASFPGLANVRPIGSVEPGLNTAPVLSAVSNQVLDELTALVVNHVAIDADEPVQVLRYALVAGPAGMTVDAVTGALQWTPGEAQDGVYAVQVKVSDNGWPVLSATNQFTVTVREVNQAPSLVAVSDVVMPELSTLVVTNRASDGDLPAQPLRLELQAGPPGMTLNTANGVLMWTPTESQGPGVYEVRVRVTDSAVPELSAEDVFTVTVAEVNAPPVLAVIPLQTVPEGQSLNLVVQVSDSDVPVNTIRFALEPGAPEGMTLDAVTGALSWTPSEAQRPGTYAATIRATDNGVPPQSSTRTFSVTAPSSQEGGTVVLANGSSTLVKFGGNAEIPEALRGTALPVGSVAVTGPADFRVALYWGPLGSSESSLRALGATVQIAPVVGRFSGGTRTTGAGTSPGELGLFQVRVWSHGATYASYETAVASANPQVYAGTSLIFTNATGGAGNPPGPAAPLSGFAGMLNVRPVGTGELPPNTAPTIAGTPDQTIDELTLLALAQSAADADQPTQTLRFSLAAGPTGMTIDEVTGLLRWTPSESQGPGVQTVRVRVTDNGLPPLSNTNQFNVTVREVNVGPTFATVNPLVIPEKMAWAFTDAAVDADLPAQPLRYALVSGPSGMTIDASRGILSWTPSESQGPGVYTVQVQATENVAGGLSAVSEFSVTVNEVNLAPVLGPILDRVIAPLATLTFTMGGAQVVDVVGLRREVYLGLAGGTAISDLTNAATFPQAPSISEILSAYFEVPADIADNYGQRVSGLLQPPTTGDYVFWVASDDNSVLFLGTNEEPASKRLVASVPEWTGPREWTKYASQQSAPISLESGRSYYVEALMKEGGGGDHLSVRWQLPGGQIEEPIPASRFRVRTQGTGTVRDDDLPAQQLTFRLRAGSPAGATLDPISGVFSWTPTVAQGPSTNLIAVIVTDNGAPSLSSTQTFKVIVTGSGGAVNQPPQLASLANQAVSEGSAWSLQASGSDPDQPAQTLTYELLAGAPSGLAINSGSGLLTWTPTEAQGPGVFGVTVRVRDNGTPALDATATFTLTVNEVNSAPSLPFIAYQVVAEGQSLAMSVAATDSDLPANEIRYALETGPAGMALDAVTGLLTWSPTESQRPGTFEVTVRATDNGSPAMIGRRTFGVATTVNGGGTVMFANLATTLVRFENSTGVPAALRGTAVPVGTTAATGPADFRVALYWGVLGSGQGQLEQLAAPALIAPVVGRFTGGTRTTGPETLPGTEATFQVRVWSHGSDYATYESALASGRSDVYVGISTLFVNPTGGAGAPPGPPMSLLGFTGVTNVRPVAEPSTMNTAPVLAAIADQVVAEGRSLAMVVAATDADVPANQIRYSLEAGPAGMTLDAVTGLLTWTPSGSQRPGTFQVTVMATDDGDPELSATRSFAVVTTVGADEGGTVTLANSTSTLVKFATSAEIPAVLRGTALPTGTSATTGPADFRVALYWGVLGAGEGQLQQVGGSALIAPIAGRFSGGTRTTGSATSAGTEGTFQVRVWSHGSEYATYEAALASGRIDVYVGISAVFVNPTGGAGVPPGPAMALLNFPGVPDVRPVVVVVGPNTAPVLAAIADQVVAEGRSLAMVVAATDADVPANQIRYSLEAGPAGMTLDAVTGLLTWTPSGSQRPGTFQVTVKATDDGDPELSATRSFAVVTTVGADEGGTVTLANSTSTLVKFGTTAEIPAVVRGTAVPIGTTAATGPADFRVALYWGVLGTGEGQLQQIGGSALIAPIAGRFSGGTRTTGSATSAGTEGTFQVRVWSHGSEYATYEAAVTSRRIDVYVGVSTVFVNPTGGAGVPPGPAMALLNFPGVPDVHPVVVGVNTAPGLASVADVTWNESATLVLANTATDAEVPGQTLTWTLLAGAPGMSLNSANGVLTWTPAEEQGPGVYAVRVKVADNGTPVLSATNAYTVTVLEINRAPAYSTLGELVFDQTLSFLLPASDPDLPASALLHSLELGPAGMALDPATGRLTWTPNPATQKGGFAVRVRATDSGGLSGSGVFAVITPSNNGGGTISFGNTSQSLLRFGSGPEIPESLRGTPLPMGEVATIGPAAFRVALYWGPVGSTESQVRQTGRSTWIGPFAGRFAGGTRYAGSFMGASVTLQVRVWSHGNDYPTYENALESGNPAVYTWASALFNGATGGAGSPPGPSMPLTGFTGGSVGSETNTAPVLAAIGDQVVPEGQGLGLVVVAVDQDVPANQIHYSLETGPSGMTLDAVSGLLTWSPSASQRPGTFAVTVKATDNGVPPKSATRSFAVVTTSGGGGGGTVVLGNSATTLVKFGTGADVPATLRGTSVPTGTSATTGPADYRVALYWGVLGSNEAQLLQVGGSALIAPLAGRFSGGTRTTGAGTSAGTEATFQVRVWSHGSEYVTYEGAATSGRSDVFVGTSALFANPTGGAGSPPGPAMSLINFGGVPNVHPVVPPVVTNTAPVLGAIADQVVPEGMSLALVVTATDGDLPPDEISYSLETGPAGMTLDAVTGLLTWSPSIAQRPGTFAVTVKATDDGVPPKSATRTFAVVTTVGGGGGGTVLLANSAATLVKYGTGTDVPAGLRGTAVPTGTSASTGPADYRVALYWGVLGSNESQLQQIGGSSSIAPVAGRFSGGTRVTGPGTSAGTEGTFQVKVWSHGSEYVTYEAAAASGRSDVYVGTSALFANPTGGAGSPPGPAMSLINFPGVTNMRPVVEPVVINTAPVLAEIEDQLVAPGQSLGLILVATDADVPENQIRFALELGPTGMTLDTVTGLLTWTPGAGQRPGTFVIRVRASDDGVPALSATRSFAVVTTESGAGGSVLLANSSVTQVRYASIARVPDVLRGTAVPTGDSLPTGPAGFHVALYWGPAGSSEGQLRQIGLASPIAPVAGRFSGGVRVTGPATPPGTEAVFQVRVWSDSFRFPTFEAAVASGDSNVFAGSSLVFTNATGGGGSPPGPPAFLLSFVGIDNVRPVDSFIDPEDEPYVFPELGVLTVDELLELSLEGLALDPDNEALRYELLDGPAGIQIDSVTGEILWTPAEWQGPASFLVRVRATDEGAPARSAEGQFVVSVREVNSAPVLSPIGNRLLEVQGSLSFVVSASDSDLPAQGLRFELTQGPAGMSLDSGTGALTWPAGAGHVLGDYPVTVRVVDDGSPALSASETFMVTVHMPNTAPVLVQIEDMAAREHALVLTTNVATDAQLPGQSLRFELVAGPEGMTVNATNGVVAWTPSELQGGTIQTVQVRVVDDGVPPMSATNEFQVTVEELNERPVFAGHADLQGDELATMSVTNSVVDADVPVQTLRFSMPVAPAGASIDPITGILTWVPSEGQGPGTHAFQVVVTDDGQPTLSVTNTFQVTIREVQSAPVLVGLPDQTVEEGVTLTLRNEASDPDLPAQTLQFSLLAGPAGATLNPTDGVLTWTPSELQGPGTHPVRIQVRDNGTPSLTTEHEFVVTVREVNRSPAIEAGEHQTLNEGVPWQYQLVADDPDVPVQTLRFGLVSGPAGLAVHADSGLITWTPGEDQGPGTVRVEVQVSDSGAPALVATTGFDLTVQEVNQAPVVVAVGDVETDELATLSLPALAVDADVPAQVLSFELLEGPTGVVLDPVAGTFRWTPTEAQGPGTYVVQVKASDSGTPALTAINEFRVTVRELNAAPVLTAIADLTAPELATLLVTNEVVDADVPSQVLSFRLLAGPPGASLDAVTGVLAWTPSEQQGPGAYAVKVAVTDDGSPELSATNEYQVTVVEVNSAPVLAAVEDRTVEERSTLILTHAATDGDVPAQKLVFALVNGPSGIALNPNSGVMTWTPSELQGPGLYTLEVKVSDDGSPSLSVTNQFRITVNEVNTAPVLASVPDRAISEMSLLTLTNEATDGDLPAQKLTFALVAGPAGMVVNAADGVLTWTPSENQGPGVHAVRVKVSDDGVPALSVTNEYRVTVNEVNTAPVLATVADKLVNEMATLNVVLTATDADVPAQALRYELVSGPASATLHPTTGLFRWTSSEADGPLLHTVVVKVSDDGSPALSTTNQFRVFVREVNVAPVLAAVGPFLVQEMALLEFTNVVTDVDLPAQVLQFQLLSGPPGGVLNTNTGVYAWTPTEAQGPGTYAVRVKVTDNGSPALSATNEVQVTVEELNAAPVLVVVEDRTVREGILLTVTNVASDIDLPSQRLIFSLVSAPTGAVLNPTNGVFTWTPSETQGPGVHQVKLKVQDNGTPSLSATNEFRVTVEEANTAPVLAVAEDQVLNEGMTLTITNRATDPDVPVQTLRFELASGPNGVTVDPETGVLTWTPSEADGFGVYLIGVRVIDDGVPALGAEMEFIVTVEEINSAPVLAAMQTQVVDELGTLMLTNAATDGDVPVQRLTFELLAGPAGLVLNNNSGVVAWTPTESQGPGAYTVRVRVTDDGVPTLSATNEFLVTVNEVNRAPVMGAMTDKLVNELTTLNLALSATDPDLPAQTLRFDLVTGPEGATVNPTTGLFTWTPTEAQGPVMHTFLVKVSDNGAPSLSATNQFRVLVREVNSAPVLTAVAPFRTPEGVAMTFTNVAIDGDVPAQTLRFQLIAGPAGGVLNTNTGVFAWTPTESQGPGNYLVRVRVLDNGSPSMGATNNVLVTVDEANTAPVLAAVEDRTVREGDTLTVTHGATDGDVPAQALTFELVSAPSGVVLNPNSGVLVWTPTEEQGPGVHVIQVKVSDNGSPVLSATREFRVTVEEGNVAPLLTLVDDQVLNELTQLTITNVATDADLPAQKLQFELVEGPEGIVVDAETGVLTWTPTEAQGYGAYLIAVGVTDDGVPAMSSTVEFVVTVEEVNVAPLLGGGGTRTVPENVRLVLTHPATDTDEPVQALRYALVSGPVGAIFDPATGTIDWTPSEAQGPGAYPIEVKVSDDGSPVLSTTTSYVVTVAEVNLAPIVVAIADQVVNETTLLTVTNVATDADLPAQTIRYDLIVGPFGATLNRTNGVFRWTPAEWQGPATSVVRVRVSDSGTPPMMATNQFQITVNELNAPPALGSVADRVINELETLTVPNTASDPDVPIQSLRYELASGPAGVTVQETTGVLTWTPSELQGPGIHVIRVKVTDNGTPAQSATNEFRVTVNEVNSAPVLAFVADVAIDELAPWTLTNGVADADLPAQTLTFSLVDGPEGAAIDPETGVLHWTPSEAQGPGTYPVQILVSDNGVPPLDHGRLLTITVKEMNVAPTLAAVADQAIRELTTLTLDLVGADTDLPAQSLQYALASGPAGMTVDAFTGRLTWTPSAEQGPGSFVVRVKVSDNGAPALEASTEFRVAVADQNNPPVLLGLEDVAVNELSRLVITNAAADSDQPPQRLTFELLEGPTGATLDPDTGVLDWTPSEAQGPGVHVVRIRVSDNGVPVLRATGEYRVTVREVNSVPTVVSGPDRSITEFSTLTVGITVADADLPAQNVVLELLAGPEGAVLDPNTGVFSWTPGEAHGPGLHTIRVKATDNGTPALSVTNQFSVQVREVNAPPAFEPVATQYVRRGSLLSVALRSIDPDLPRQDLRFSLLDAPTGVAVNPTSGLLTWTPGQGVTAGVYPVRVRVTDSGSPALSASLDFNILVEVFNAMPVLVQIEDQTLDEVVAWTITNLASDPDQPGQTLRHELLVGPAGMTINPSTGVILWTPAEAQGPAVYDVKVRVFDDGTPVFSATNDFRLTVREVNTPPLLTSEDDVTLYEFQRLAMTSFTLDTDLPAQDLQYELLAAPAGMTVHAGSGFVSWTPGETDGPGTYTVRLKVSDHGVPALSSTNEFRVTVREINTGPTIARVADLTLTEGQSLGLTMTATDPDVPLNTVRFSLDPSSPAGVTLDPVSGLVRWTPAEWQRPGVYTITVHATDDGVPAVSAVRSFAVTLTGATGGTVTFRNSTTSMLKYGSGSEVPASLRNLPLAATAGGGSGLADYRVSLYWGVLGSSDAQLRQIGPSAPVTPVAGRFSAGTRATGAATAPGSEATFQVRVWSHASLYSTYEAAVASGDPRVFIGSSTLFRNGTGGAGSPPSPAVTLGNFTGIPDVHPLFPGAVVLNTAPVLVPLPDMVIDETSTLVVTNTALDADLPLQTLRYELLTGPAGAILNPLTGVLTWTPSEAQFWGTVLMRVKVSDNGEPVMSATNEFYVSIDEVNLAPVLGLIPDQTLAPGQTLTYRVTATDGDLPADQLWFSLDPGAPAGMAIDPMTGELTWVPGPAQSLGVFAVTARVTDDGFPALSATRTFHVSLLQLQTAIDSLSILPDGTVVLVWTPIEGLRVEVEYSDDLGGQWTVLENAGVGVAEDHTPNAAFRFYRLKLSP